MGMRAFVMALGKYSKAVEHCLEYPANHYESTSDGSLVFSSLFNCNTTAQSMELADILGVKAWDFNTHVLNPAIFTDNVKAKILALIDEPEDLQNLDALIAAGFRFVYRPEG